MSQRESAVQVRVSRLGWQFGFIGVCAMLGGAVRAYNLPLVLAGMIVGALLLHWRWGRQTILAVTVSRRLPDEAFAGERFAMPFLVTNHSRWMPAWLLRIDDLIRPQGLVQAAAERPRTSHNKAAATIKASCGLGVVPAGRTLTAQYDCSIARRGCYEFGPMLLSTGVPLGLMIAQQANRDVDTLYVFPRRTVLKRRWRQILQSRLGGNATNSRRSGIQEGEFFGIRGWQAGDSRRWIHWRTTARTGEPAVRQFEQQRRFELCILVDGYLGTATAGADGDAERAAADEALELVISAAATLIAALVATPTSKIGLVLAGQQIAALTSGGGREQTIAMMRKLSELNGSPAPDLSAAVRQMIQTVGRPQDLLIISPRHVVAESQSLVNLLARRSVLRWCSVADGSIDQLIERFPADVAAVESHEPAISPSGQDASVAGAASSDLIQGR